MIGDAFTSLMVFIQGHSNAALRSGVMFLHVQAQAQHGEVIVVHVRARAAQCSAAQQGDTGTGSAAQLH